MKVTTSIIILTYNRAQVLAEAIQSVLSQRYQDYEIIIVDDGSTDDTPGVVQQMLEGQRYQYHLVQHTGNLSKLRNYGLKNADGEFVAYLDSDDLWHEEKLEQQMSALNQYPGAGVTVTSHQILDGHCPPAWETLQPPTPRPIDFSDLLWNRRIVYPSSVVFRKSVLEKAGQHDEAFLWNDLGFIAKLMAHSGGLVIDSPLTAIRKHTSNVSIARRTEAIGFRGMLSTIDHLCQSSHLSTHEAEKLRFFYNSRMGQMLKQEREYTRAAAAFSEAMRHTWFPPATFIRFLQSRILALIFDEN